ncbi:thioredoxin [archaeon]|nr:thioredoxin [archaeon]
MTVKELTLENFEEEVINSDVPIIIDFFADWCGPCQMMKPVFQSVSEEYKGKLKFLKLDTQEEQGLAMKFGIQGIPAFVMVNNGKEVGRIVGYMNEDMFKERINNVLERL